jgi:Ca2+/Na+ antiporter
MINDETKACVLCPRRRQSRKIGGGHAEHDGVKVAVMAASARRRPRMKADLTSLLMVCGLSFYGCCCLVGNLWTLVFIVLSSNVSIRLNYIFTYHPTSDNHSHTQQHQPPLLSLRAGILWLFIITLCISSMSDILVNTLEGFAQRANLSQVFTSLVVVPYFSNIAEQASAILFAYRNEMDLCIGVSVGSAIQIGALVMPGSVLIGYLMDRSMTLYFHGFETMCYLFAVVVVGAVVQGGTTNWLVGATMIAMYVMMAAGFWVHETEDLSVDAEEFIRNTTGT